MFSIPYLGYFHLLKIMFDDLFRRLALLRHAVSSPLAHAHAMAVAFSSHMNFSVLYFQTGQQGGTHFGAA